MNGWFPRINRRGQIVSGNAGIWLTEPTGASRQIAPTGIGPLWLTDDLVLYNGNDNTTRVWPTGDLVPAGYNIATTNERGKWAGFQALGAGFLHVYEGTRKIREIVGVAAPVWFGDQLAWIDQPQADSKSIVVDGHRVYGPAAIVGFSGPPLVAEIATGTYTRTLEGTPSLYPHEGGPLVRDGWVLTGSTDAGGLLLRPLGEIHGYFLPGDEWYYADFRIVNQELVIAASTHDGQLRVQRMPLTQARVDLRSVVPAPTPPAPPAPQPTPQPTPEPKPTMPVPNRSAELAAFWQQWNGKQPITDDAKKHEFTAAFMAYLNAHDGSGRWGRKSRVGNAPVSKDTAGYWLGASVPTTPTDGKVHAFDLISGGTGAVSWDHKAENGDPGYANIDARWYPVAVAASNPGAPAPAPGTPAPAPAPSVDLTPLQNELAALAVKCALLEGRVDALMALPLAKRGDVVEVTGSISVGDAFGGRKVTWTGKIK